MSDPRTVDREVLELTEDLRRGTIDPERMARLNRLLDRDVALRQLYVEYNDQLASLAPEVEENEVIATLGSRGQAASRRASSRWVSGAVAAAVLAVVCSVGVALRFGGVAMSPPVGKVAVVADGTVWASEPAAGGDAFGVGAGFAVESGFVSLDLGRDVRLDLVGPAQMRVDGPDRVWLSSGLVAGTVGPDGRGFMVRTEDADVVDLGTEFVVHKNYTVGTRVDVRSGRVEARLKDESGRTVKIVELLADQRGRFDHVSVTADGFVGGLEDLLARYTGVSRARGGVLRYADGAVPLAEPDRVTDLRTGMAPTAGRVFVIPERRGVELAEALTVPSPDGPVTLPAGTRIDSYLFHFDVGDGLQLSHVGRGAVTFGGAVAAVLTSADALAATDDDFGLPAATFDPVPHRGLESETDTVAVTADHRSVTFDLDAEVLRVLDQFRVLVIDGS